MIKEIQTYFNTVLKPQLSSYGVSLRFQSKIYEVIEKQMYSVFVNWDEQNFIKTLFLTVSEEAPFYSSDAKDYVKSFVVLTIRNSPIETLQSDNYHKSSLKSKLDDNQIQQITSAAIRYFDDVDFSAAADNEEYEEEKDIYYLLLRKYSIAWNALNHVANDGKLAGSFEGLQYVKVPYFLNVEVLQEGNQKTKPSVLDGYDPVIDADLRNQLSLVIGSKSAICVDCFKMLSRNMEKVLLVIDYLLHNQCSFVTSNYYIGNGYYEKRVPVIKAASSHNAMRDMKEHYKNLTGVGEIHKKYLLAAVNEWV